MISYNDFSQLLRIHQPAAYLLLLTPVYWTFLLAGKGQVNIQLLTIFTLGGLIMRSAGCIINDILDCKLDAKVARTKLRPIASGRVTVKVASRILAMLLLMALALVLLLSTPVIILGFVAIIPICLYPLMKRVTYLPQLFLGMTFNWGVLMAWVEITGRFDVTMWCLYLSALLWTLGYDTIYGHMDKKDDQKIGIKSTALLFASHSKKIVFGCYLLSAICLAGAVFYVTHQIFSALLVALLAATGFSYSLIGIELDNKEQLKQYFTQQAFIGILICVLIYVSL